MRSGRWEGSWVFYLIFSAHHFKPVSGILNVTGVSFGDVCVFSLLNVHGGEKAF